MHRNVRSKRLQRRKLPLRGLKSFHSVLKKKSIDTARFISVPLALFGIANSYLFGFTLRFDNDIRTLIDSYFLVSQIFTLVIFSAGVVVFSKIFPFSLACAVYSVDFISVQLLYRTDVGLRTNEFSEKGAFRSGGFETASALIVSLFLYFWLMQFLLNWVMSLMFLLFCFGLLLMGAVLYRFETFPNEALGKRGFQSVFFDYVLHSFRPTSYIGNSALMKVNVAVVLFVAFGLGDARFRSITAELQSCVLTTNGSMQASLVGNSSDGYFLAEKTYSELFSSIFSIAKPKTIDGLTYLPRSEVKRISTGNCTE